MKKRVVITGMGVVSSLGYGSETFWEAIKAGKSGISTVERIDVSNLPTKVAAEIKDFDATGQSKSILYSYDDSKHGCRKNSNPVWRQRL